MLHFSIVTLEQYVGQLHPIFWYFPLFFFSGALVADLFYYFDRPKAFIIGHWLIIVGVLSFIPTLITGSAAEVNYDAANFFVEKHRHLGFTTAIAGSFYAGLRISAMLWTLPLKAFHYAFLSMLMVAMILWTSDFGWLIHTASAGN